MGMIRDAKIAGFQQATGIKPATGEELALLERIQDAAFDIIRIVENHKSGICDGDGAWGGDVMGGLLRNIKGAHRQFMELSVVPF